MLQRGLSDGDDEVATKLSAVRTRGCPGVVGRAYYALFGGPHVLKRVNGDMKSNEDIRGR